MRLAIYALLLIGSCLAPLQAQQKKADLKSYPPVIADAKAMTYKKVGDVELKLWVFSPKEQTTPKPAILFFFGGGWTSGTPTQFERHCRHFAERGMVAITVDYRVASRHRVKPAQCVADAKSAVRWVREHAAELKIDPDKIVVSGGSAGGHLAASTATLPGLDEAGESTKTSCVPNALILFNPCVVTAPKEGVDLKGFASNTTAEKAGCDPVAISPLHHVKAGLPATLILHGKADTTVPYVTVEAFTKAMTAAGNQCQLIGYADQPHGFFNQAKYQETLQAADDFLVKQGYLPKAK